jgi:DNA-binding transcriptional LysR family regulator
VDTRLLQSYLAVLECGSVTQAARNLGYSQSAVSQHLASLEALVGVRLFERREQPLRATACGELIYPHARATILLVGDLYAVTRRFVLRPGGSAPASGAVPAGGGAAAAQPTAGSRVAVTFHSIS